MWDIQIKPKDNALRSALKKFNGPTLVLFLLVMSAFFAYLIDKGDLKMGVIVILGLVGPPLVFSIIAFPRFGIIVLLFASFFIMMIIRMNLTTFPLGTVMDGLQAMLILGYFIKQKYEPDWTSLRNPISIMITIWIAYNFIEVINPIAASKMAWLYTIRSVAITQLTYYVFSYHIKSISFVRTIIKLWLALGLFAAAYASKQQFIGFAGFEERYLYSDPLIMNLLFIAGEWRKFSIFSDPVAFSYNMVMCALWCIGLMFGPISFKKKILLGCMLVFFMMNMLFSGTRGAFVLVPAALCLLPILKFSKKVMFFTGVGAIFVVFLIFVPTSNARLFRFQTAFKPGKDESFNVRAENQRMIQPFIRSHPLGGGLGATGVWGIKFAPDSFLAKFPPDSGYVRVAVELGWIGLLIFCTLIFVILRAAINNYYKIKDPELKSYALAMVMIVFAMHIGNYPQEALVQYPSNILFFLVAAMINITARLDREKTLNTHE